MAVIDERGGHPYGSGYRISTSGEAIRSGQEHVADVIDTTIYGLQTGLERLASLEYRLTRLADRYVGSVPVPIEANKQAPHNDTVQALVRELGSAVDRLFAQLDRLNDR